MSNLVSDPASLTKEKLKLELAKFNVYLPSDARKSVYVDLYRTHVLNQTSEFSADEGSPKPKKKSRKKTNMDEEGIEVSKLENSELADMLKKLGVDVGPILPTTRRVYEAKLIKLLASGDAVAQEDTVPLDEIDFSADSEPEEPPVVEPPVVEPVRRRQTRSSPPKVPDSPPKQRRPPATPPRQYSTPVIPSKPPRTPPTLPRDARLVRPPVRPQSGSSASSTRPSSNVSQKQEKRGMSLWLQIAVFVIVAVIIFFVIQNMEPASSDPLQGLESKTP